MHQAATLHGQGCCICLGLACLMSQDAEVGEPGRQHFLYETRGQVPYVASQAGWLPSAGQ